MAGLREHGVDPSGKTLGSLTPAVWEGALDRGTWERLRVVLLNPERSTNVRTPNKRLLTGLIRCGAWGAAMQARPRDDQTKRYVCAGRQEGHQMAIVAEAADEVVAERVMALLTTPSVRRILLGDRGQSSDDGDVGQALAHLGSAQRRLHALDAEYYVRGVLAQGRYRSVTAKPERGIDRFRSLVDAATKSRIVLHQNPREYWAGADISQRREPVRLLVDRVTILPARRGVPPIRTQRCADRTLAALRAVVAGPLNGLVSALTRDHQSGR